MAQRRQEGTSSEAVDEDVKYSILKSQPKLLDLAKDEILVVLNNELGMSCLRVEV